MAAPVEAVEAVEVERPMLLFYCQHSLGLGHLVRSLALADGLASRFAVTILNGGRLPDGTVIPQGVEIVNLPPLGHDDEYNLISHDPSYTVDDAKVRRTATLLAYLARRPAVLLIELYPFGRKKFAFELVPLLEAAASMGSFRPLTVCSLRDILVGQRRDQARHDERASQMANKHFDAILVHADPRFARLEESLKPVTPLRPDVFYTGFVTSAPTKAASAEVSRQDRVLVSAGGGMVGEPLFRAAVNAAPLIFAATGMRTRIVAGPFAPEATWAWLESVAQQSSCVEVVRYVPDLLAEMKAAAVTVSQCGYNTTMDILRSGTPALVVPYAEGREDEQSRRAERLAATGVLRQLPLDQATGVTFAEHVIALRGLGQPPVTLDLDGRTATATILSTLVRVRSRSLAHQRRETLA